jgi:hypothetical protein
MIRRFSSVGSTEAAVRRAPSAGSHSSTAALSQPTTRGSASATTAHTSPASVAPASSWARVSSVPARSAS